METNTQRNVVQKLQRIIGCDDNEYNSVTNDSTARLMAVLVSEHSHYNDYIEDLKIFLNYIVSSSLKSGKKLSDYMLVVCLSHVLLVPGMTKYFLTINGMKLLKDILDKHSNDLQIMYYSFLLLWIMSFENVSQSHFSDPTNRIVPLMINALKNISREKLSRVAFKIFKNVSKWEACIELMVENDLNKVVENELRKNLKDDNLHENLDFLADLLDKNAKIFSSFENYVKEIKAGELNWGPCHRESFWKNNVKRFEENDWSLIQLLIKLLDSNKEVTKAVAAYDIGEFCRYHPHSRLILDKYGGKAKMMALIKSESNTVREQALLATQKMMIMNWQSLKI